MTATEWERLAQELSSVIGHWSHFEIQAAWTALGNYRPQTVYLAAQLAIADPEIGRYPLKLAGITKHIENAQGQLARREYRPSRVLEAYRSESSTEALPVPIQELDPRAEKWLDDPAISPEQALALLRGADLHPVAQMFALMRRRGVLSARSEK